MNSDDDVRQKTGSTHGMTEDSRQRTRQYPRRGSIYWERHDGEFVASEHTAQTEGRGETPHEAVRDYLRQLEQ